MMERLAIVVIECIVLKEAVALTEKVISKNSEWIAINILKK